MFWDKMPDYSKSIIYTIRTREGVYVGSTTNFTKRKCLHKSYIKYKNSKLYQTIRDNGGEWDMKPYKEFPCETKQQLNIEEERIRCELKADLNLNCCSGLDAAKISKRKKEYYEKRKKEIADKQKIYYEDNKEQILKNKKEKYYERKKD